MDKPKSRIELSDGWLDIEPQESGALKVSVRSQSVVFALSFYLPQHRIDELIAALQAAKGDDDGE